MKKLPKLKKPKINKDALIEKADKIFVVIMIALFLFISIELLYFIYGVNILGNINHWTGIFTSYYQAQIASFTFWKAIIFFSIAALFFLPSPLEVFYYNFLNQGTVFWKLYLATLIGLFIAQHFNYFFGRMFSSYLEKHMKEKKLTKYKSRIEKFGGYAIFVMHLFPLPYSIFNAVVGLTGYPYKKWLKWAFSALAINYVFITILYFIIN